MVLKPQRWSLKQKQGAHVAACRAIVAAAMASGLSVDTPTSTYQLPSNSEVISYLLQSVNWHRHVCTERQVANEPADLMFLDGNQAIKQQIVKLSFEFAKADAMLETSAASAHGRPSSSDPPPADLAHFTELKSRNERNRARGARLGCVNPELKDSACGCRTSGDRNVSSVILLTLAFLSPS
jgi:hypothetical protein